MNDRVGSIVDCEVSRVHAGYCGFMTLQQEQVNCGKKWNVFGWQWVIGVLRLVQIVGTGRGVCLAGD